MVESNGKKNILAVVEIPDRNSLSHFGPRERELPLTPPGEAAPAPDLGVVKARLEGQESAMQWVLDLSGVKASWLLLAAPGETLEPKGLDDALDILKRADEKPLLVSGNIRLSPAMLKTYEWAGTRDVFSQPADSISTVFTQIPRLIPVSRFRKKGLAIALQPEGKGALAVQGLPPAIQLKLAPLTLNAGAPKPLEKKEKPSDRTLFMDGHGLHYDDTEFCARFSWPPSMYLLIRKAHIPGIIEGMKMGLGNTEILSYAFNYLTLTGDFGSAERLIPLTPEHWFAQSPMLAQVCGAVLTMRGRLDEALAYFEKARNLDKGDPAALFNLAKMYLVTGHRDKAREVFGECLRDPDLPPEQRSGVLFFLNAMDSNPESGATLTLCVIARDEEEALPRALASASGLVDEIVVVDAGSSDSTREKALENGAKFFDFAWEDDFSAARNFAMDKASGDFVFFLDADERLSPFHRINLLFLKALLSRKAPRAYELSIGRTDVTTDWLIISALPDNFIQQASQVRIFPRSPEIRWEGRVVESVSASLEAADVAVTSIPPGQLDIIHDEFGRDRRVLRKSRAYELCGNPSEMTLMAAVQDFSSIRDEARTVQWLKALKLKQSSREGSWRLMLRLALMMEDSDPEFSRKTYEEILDRGVRAPRVLNAFASFLVRNKDFEALGALDFEGAGSSFEDSTEEKTFITHHALARLGARDVEGSAQLLEKILEMDHGFILAQAARFFMLSALGVTEGALLALDDVAALVRGEAEAAENPSADFISKIESAAKNLENTGRAEERGLILEGAVHLVSGREDS